MIKGGVPPPAPGDIVLKIRVKENVFELAVSEEMTVNQLKAKVEQRINATSKQYIRLIHAGKLLMGKETVGYYKLPSGSFIHAALSEVPVAAAPTIAETPLPPRESGPRRGFDVLSNANSALSTDDIQAIRLHFAPSVSRYAETMIDQDGESPPNRFLRAEQEWMSQQQANSEFRINVQPLTGMQAGVDEEPSLGMEDLMVPGVAGAEGTNTDFMWGFVMGFLLGFILLFWLFERSLPRRQKLGIIAGVGLNIIVGAFRQS
jgi:hypothetical protein